MIQIIREVLSQEELKEVRTQISTATFVDGGLTAAGLARDVKNNEQLPTGEHLALMEQMNAKIGDIPQLINTTLASKMGGTRISRYRTGMEYGSHVDSPYMDEVRSDYSLTLFLSAPEGYEGGELVIESELGEAQIKLPAGDMVVYPSDRLHRVNPITSGERLALVTWIQSRIQDPEQRQTLIELRRALQQIGAMEQTEEIQRLTLRLLKAANKLERMWGG